MKVSLKWLRQYVDTGIPPVELADRLTMAGCEVKGQQVIGGSWDNIVIGEVAAVNPHPNADRLTLVTVNLGKEAQTVVCGAPNVRAGGKVAFAYVGAQLTDPHTGQTVRLKPAKIRGVVSAGMVCSERELGISQDHEGILLLPTEAPVGAPLTEYMGDVIFDLEVTPNRPDCLSIIGIAREAAALTGKPLHIPEISYPEAGTPIDRQVTVEIVAPDLCPRYCASLIKGIKLGPSPRWMQEALLACGMRPINNIVDITNYVMLEYGQPLHAFDYEMLRGRKIIVRRAGDGESITSLDGVERQLSATMLVIADRERAVAVAGVMGGANSEVTEQTTTILLEAASFKPTSIHYTARTLNMRSEASTRFERGIRPELTVPALRRATQLILQLAGGEAAPGIVDVYPGKTEPKPILLSTQAVKRVLGAEFSLDQMTGVLTSLGFACQNVDTRSAWVAVPYWRGDVRQAVDLAEEVARVAGYDKIPATLLGEPLPKQEPAPIVGLKREVRQRLTGYGFQEIVAYSLVSRDMLSKLSQEPGTPLTQPLRLLNPMSAEQEVLRPTLRASLLAALAANRRFEEGGIRLFELARVYLPRSTDLPDEREMLCGLLSGQREEKSWEASHEPADFYDAKGDVEDLLSRLGVPVSFVKSADDGLHPSHQAAVMADGNRVGVLGEVHPKVREAFEIGEPAYLFELDMSALVPFLNPHQPYRPLPRFPAIVRDMALVVDASVTHQQLADIMESFPMVAQVEIFDVYSGAQVPAGKKSLAYRITYQSPQRTLTDDEVNEVQAQVLSRLAQEVGAGLRG